VAQCPREAWNVVRLVEMHPRQYHWRGRSFLVASVESEYEGTQTLDERETVGFLIACLAACWPRLEAESCRLEAVLPPSFLYELERRRRPKASCLVEALIAPL
jgi:hypothetical protein